MNLQSPSFEDALSRSLGGAQVRIAATLSQAHGHDCLCVEAGARRIFVKAGPEALAPRMQAEASGLNRLRACGAFRVPQVIACDASDEHAWLALEWLELSPVRSAEDGVAFAEALSRLHAETCDTYGLEEPSYLGATKQDNAPSENWSFFFAHKRLSPQLAAAARKGFRGELQSLGEQIVERCGAFFLDDRPRPALLHGDLWYGNAGMVDGRPAVFDPACYRGDREADVAMMELFGGFPSSTYRAYRERMPLSDAFEFRKPLYNFYQLLNHLNLFGRGYLREAERTAARLVASIRT